jgi:hypothetical protein
MFTKYKGILPRTQISRRKHKLGSTPVVHAMILKTKYILLQGEYHNKNNNMNI